MVAGLAAAAGAVLIGVDSIAVVLTIGLAFFVMAAIAIRFIEVVGARPERPLAATRKVVGNEPGYWGGQVAHIGIALMAISLATTNGLAVRETVTIEQKVRARRWIAKWTSITLDKELYQELGKVLAGVILSELKEGDAAGHDCSTTGLISHFISRLE